MNRFYFLIFINLSPIFYSCNLEWGSQLPDGDWIKGNDKEKISIIESQFRGFDKAMVETGYRYQELYWGIQDENWQYSDYQLKKIKRAIETGLERRPKRAKSAEPFLEQSIHAMKSGLDSKNKAKAMESFSNLQKDCNACHAREGVPFFRVGIPDKRNSPIR